MEFNLDLDFFNKEEEEKKRMEAAREAAAREEKEERERLEKIYFNLKGCAFHYFPPKKKNYHVERDGKFYPCSLESFLNYNKNLFACRIYNEAHDYCCFNPTMKQLRASEAFWLSLTDDERQIINDISELKRK